MKRNKWFQIIGLLALWNLVSCEDQLTFPDVESPNLPGVKESSARLLWIGPEYKVAVSAVFEDEEGISKIGIKNGEWRLNKVINIDKAVSYVLEDTFIVDRDVNPTQHFLDFTITNSKGGITKTKVEVEDLSSENQIPDYSPDLLPPVITVTKPTITRFYGLSDDPIIIEIEADVADLEIESVAVTFWGEAADGESVWIEDNISIADEADKTNYLYNRSFELPVGKAGEFQYVVKSTDVSGNKSVRGGIITVGYLDRMYLSDAVNEDEVLKQGFDHYGACRGIGTLISMKKQGANTFVADYYYRNEPDENIRFVAFLGGDRPFVRDGSTNQAKVNYTFEGFNVVAASSQVPGTITTDLSAASFKLPVDAKGYYRIAVDMTARTISAVPFTPAIPVDAVKFPKWSDDDPWPYLAVTGSTVVGTAGWTETATSPKLMKDPDHPYLYTGTFQTNGSSSNMSLNAPLAVLDGDIWGKGWFRLKAGRAAMVDDYGDVVTIVAPVGPSGGGANWGFSLSPVGTYKVTYDLALERFRAVWIGE